MILIQSLLNKYFTKRRSIFYFAILLPLLIANNIFGADFFFSSLFWIGATICIDTFYTEKLYLKLYLTNILFVRKMLLYLFFSIALFAVTDSQWDSLQWLKSYIDNGTLLFVLLFFFSIVVPIDKKTYALIVVFTLSLIPVAVISGLPIIADTFTVFSLLLLARIIIGEIMSIRRI